MYATRDNFPPAPNPHRSKRRSAQRRTPAAVRQFPPEVPRSTSSSSSRGSRASVASSSPQGSARHLSRQRVSGSHSPRAYGHSTGRVSQRKSVHPTARQQRVASLTRETAIKLSINTLLIGLSAAALAKLVPSHLTQQSQLREIRSELAFTRERVDQLRADFTRTFDPMQAYTVMQQQSHLIDPNQRPVVFTQKGTTTDRIQP